MWARKQVTRMSGRSRQTRKLHTENTRVIQLRGNTVANIAQTALDRKKEEAYQEYRARSLQQLCAQFPKQLRDKDIFAFKLNLSAIDPESQPKKIQHFEIGHIAAAVVRVDDEGIKFAKDSVVSKTRKAGFEEQEDYVAEKFISKDYPPADYPIKEFYMFVDPAKFGENAVDIYLEMASRLKFENRPYDLFHDACGHAVHEAFTGEKLESYISAQTAFQKTIAKLVESDPELRDSLNKAMRDLGMTKKGDVVGREFLEHRALKNLPRPTPSSSE